MKQMIMAEANGRAIGKPDTLFGVSSLAKQRISEIGKENVVDATLGVLLTDEGRLAVLSSVAAGLKQLSPEDYAEYAPIAGIPSYGETVKKAVFLDEMPKAYVETCFTPGGTGALRNAVSCYTKPGEAVLTGDWHWSPYRVIAEEQGRRLETYQLFNERGTFHNEAFSAALSDLLSRQDGALIIINTPAHNPTGYTFTEADWDRVIETVKKFPDKKIRLLVDIAYLDFSGDPKEYRKFFGKLCGLPEHILPLIAFSASKGFTLYGMRCGALLCMAPSLDIAKEFLDVNTVSSRACWSNGNRAAMTVLSNIFSDEKQLLEVRAEREEFLKVLRKRGKAFMDAAKSAGLNCCPYDSGFFVTVPCQNAVSVGKELQKYDIFAIPLGEGVRVSVASITEEECAWIPEKLKKAVEAVNNRERNWQAK